MTIIKCHRRFLEERCFERGYSLKEVQDCIVEEEGDMISVDSDHPAYPRKTRLQGPGEELKKILKGFGLAAVEGCACKGRARKMNAWGADGCEKHIDEIVGWLEEESRKRKLPFLRWPAKVLVKVAIRRARRHENAAKGT